MRFQTGRWLLGRAVNAIAVLWGLVTLIFILFHVLPADSAQMTLGQRSDPETLREIRKELGLDLPWGQRYAHFLRGLSPVDWRTEEGASKPRLVIKAPHLGRSYQSRRDVVAMVGEAFSNTLVLALAAMALATFLGIGLGSWAAVTPSPALKSAIMGLAMSGVAAPSFVVALLMAYVFGYLFAPWTGLSMTGSLKELDALNGWVWVPQNLVLPALTLGIRPLAVVVQLTKDSVTDVLAQDYIRTAKAKGLPTHRIWRKHVWPNALNPVITALSGWLSSMLAGAVFVEYIFGWQGMGKLTVDALMVFDLPVVMGVVLWSGFLFVLINILVDWLYSVLDPRVQWGTVAPPKTRSRPLRVFLVGMPGSGKSTAGPVLAQSLGWDFEDLDLRIEKETGSSIPKILEEKGEDEFRELETHWLMKTANVTSLVVATGGGAALRNMAWMLENGWVVWLDTPLEEIKNRLIQSPRPRPLLQSEGSSDLGALVESMYFKRSSHYAQSHHRVRDTQALLAWGKSLGDAASV